MDEFKIGDVVIRKSYGGDVYFKIVQIIKRPDGGNSYMLKGTNLRILADSPEEDLIKPGMNRISENDEMFQKKVNSIIKKIAIERRGRGGLLRGAAQKNQESITFAKTGTVLHIDGDEEYLNMCLQKYKQLGVEANGSLVSEANQPRMIQDLLKQYRPDILVLTGHDGMLKGSLNFRSLDSYRSSRYFVESVRKAREYQSSYDELVIFAGACQSHYEAIIEAGANYASSPMRVLIHALDPVFICEKIAYSSISKLLSPQEVLENTVTGSRGIGGLETRGKARAGIPKSPYV